MRRVHTDQPRVLVVDRCPERASRLQELISNSGINVRFTVCLTPHELACALETGHPACVIAGSDAFEYEDIPQAVRVLTDHPIPVILALNEGDEGFMRAALAQITASVAHATRPDLLSQLVQDALNLLQHVPVSPSDHSQLEELQQQSQLLFQQANEAIAYAHEGFHVKANRAYLDCLRIETMAELSGLSLLELMRGIDCDLRSVLKGAAFEPLESRTVSVMVQDALGREFMGELHLSRVRFDGEDCIQLRLSEIDASAGRRNGLPGEASTDRMTGLLDRTAFLSRLDRYLSEERARAPTNALLFLQPDGFEEYQDTLGYAGADHFLADFAAMVRRCLGDSDIGCRFSDQGLVVLLRREASDSPDRIAQAILDRLAEHKVKLEHIEIGTRCNIGMTFIGPSMSCADEAIRQARVACRQAAEQGHALVRYKPKLSMVALDASSHAGWEERLRFGLDHGHFYSLQHSVVNLEDEHESHLECRSYLREDQGDIDQDAFQPAADACNMSAELDRALLPGLLDAIAGQPGSARHILNISLHTLLDEGFTAWIAQEMTRRDIACDRLLFQLPAQSVVEHRTAVRHAAQSLVDMGCRLALSGFTGEARFLKLLAEPGVALIKLDPVLTDKLLAGEEHRDVVRPMVETAAAAGVDIVVDGIRHATHLAALWQSGIKLVAGDFLQQSSRVAGQ